jgi:hypothetical protein
MWISWVKTKDTTQVMYIAKIKDGPKRAAKFSQMIFGKSFWNGMMEGKKMGSYKKDFEVAMFFSSQNIDFPFLFEETLWAFIFLSIFSYALSLWGLGDFEDIWGERQPSKIIFKQHGMIWLIHDYEDGGFVDISVVDAYSGVELCTPIFLGESRKQSFWMVNHFWKKSKLKMDTSPNKAQHNQELLCG